MFHLAVEQYAENEAIVDGDCRSTWNEHSIRVSRLCNALANQLGVAPSDRFAVLALNSHQYLELWHAAFMGAGVINPLNRRLAPKELAYIVEDSGTEIVFVDATFAPLVAAAREHMANDPVRKVVLIGQGDVPHDLAYERLLSGASPVFPDDPEEDDPVVLMYTGGTTGLPKGVLIEHRAEILNLCLDPWESLHLGPESAFRTVTKTCCRAERLARSASRAGRSCVSTGKKRMRPPKRFGEAGMTQVMRAISTRAVTSFLSIA
jgi:acyl-CoA synthetase (AMP-forming)/AMP-acid ligase II